MRMTWMIPMLLVAACGDSPKLSSDAPVGPKDGGIDSPLATDAPLAPDAPPTIDAPIVPSGIEEARAAADGTGLSLAITNVTVTYLKPQIGNATNDPAGFTVQASPTGPALFVTVDPATLTPVLAVGDVVSFTITTMGTVGLQRRAQAITNLTRSATGTDVSSFVQNVSAATDLISDEPTYDSELVTVTGTLFESFVASGNGFLRAGLNTAGIANDDPNLQFRAPTTLVAALDLEQGCQITATNIVVSRFNVPTQLNAYAATELTVTGCPAPTVVSALALSSTAVRITFSRNILASSVAADGSQLTFDNGLVASAATVSGRTVDVTTSAQVVGTTYTVTVADTVTDLQGTGIGSPNTATFPGFVTPAVVRINEVNANLTGGCDLIELRVVAGGSLTSFKLQERNGGAGELGFTFPNLVVQTNAIIVVHTGANLAACNPGNATSETTTSLDQPAVTFPGNFDTAFDFWSADTGLTNTDNVVTLFDAGGTIIDALFASDNPAGAATAAATETAAAAVGAANQWDPALAAYPDAVFRTNAADDLNLTGTTVTGTSIQRLDNTDDNTKADWTTGAGADSTFGLLNVGQTPF